MQSIKTKLDVISPRVTFDISPKEGDVFITNGDRPTWKFREVFFILEQVTYTRPCLFRIVGPNGEQHVSENQLWWEFDKI